MVVPFATVLFSIKSPVMFVTFVKVPVLQSLSEVQNTEGARIRTAKRAMAATDDNVRIEKWSFVVDFMVITAFRMAKVVNNVLVLKNLQFK